MSDVLTKTQRSYCMSKIKNSRTKPEVRLSKFLWNIGLRYRLKNNCVGRPDIVFPGKKVAIFVDGCFWHKCPIHFVSPKTNSEFWEAKIESNVRRDHAVSEDLKNRGWKVIRIWEHEIKIDIQSVATRIRTMVLP